MRICGTRRTIVWNMGKHQSFIKLANSLQNSSISQFCSQFYYTNFSTSVTFKRNVFFNTKSKEVNRNVFFLLSVILNNLK